MSVTFPETGVLELEDSPTPGVAAVPVTDTAPVAPPVNDALSVRLFADRSLSVSPLSFAAPSVFRLGVSTLESDTLEAVVTAPGVGVFHGVATAGLTIGAAVTEIAAAQLTATTTLLVIGGPFSITSGGGAIVFAGSGTASASTTGIGALNFGGTGTATATFMVLGFIRLT